MAPAMIATAILGCMFPNRHASLEKVNVKLGFFSLLLQDHTHMPGFLMVHCMIDRLEVADHFGPSIGYLKELTDPSQSSPASERAVMADVKSEEEPIAPALTSTPSFQGRLKLEQFMYTSSEKIGTSIRRSPRLSTPLSATLSPSRSPSKGVSPSPARPSKRKSELQLATSTNTSTPQTSSPSPRKRNRKSSSYAPPSTYSHLPLLPDVLGPDLLILFVGLNPGIQTARSGHAYAHPSNLFWKLLYSSGITPVPCRAEEDRTLPERFALGNTNIVERPSRNGAELSKAEMDEGVEVLEEKIRKWRPEVVCVVGKSIWESIWRVRKGRGITKAEFRYGWQDEGENMGVKNHVEPVIKEEEREEEDGKTSFEGAKVFVATSTSGLAASLRPEEKQKIWNELGDWCKNRRKERKAVAG